MTPNTFIHKLDDQLPDPTMDRHLVSCHKCGAKPNNINIHRKGPTILCYSANSYRVVCLKCWHKGRPGRTAQKALENWNKGKSKINIKQLRENLGWSQNELARRANVSTDSISMWETGHRYYHFDDDPPLNWRPSIFMPRWASRILLEIIDINVERLQDITMQDAVAEGIPTLKGTPEPRVSFRLLWDEINAKRGYPWKDDPWVWVIEFKMITPERN